MKKIIAILCFSFSSLLNAQEKPNIVFLMADDLTYFDIGAYGSKDAITPNIDALAKQGLKFNNFFQAAPMCSPTRHNLMTGIYPVRSGAYPNHTFVEEGTKSVVQHLKPLGYRVALSGKRHISPQSVFDFEYLGDKNNPDFFLVDEFLEEVNQNQEPFCLFLTSNEPHAPWDKGDTKLFDPSQVELPPYFVDTPETRKAFVKYLAEINYLDQQVEKALSLLEKHNLLENTIFIFTSEQGNQFPFAKWTTYDSGLQTAFIVRWPGVIKEARTTNALADYTDVVPTFIDIAGGDIPSGLDGKSFLKVLKDKATKHKNYSFGIQTTRGIHYGSEHFGTRAVTDGRYRLVINLSPEADFQNIVTNHPKKPFNWWNSWEEAAKTNKLAQKRVSAYQKRPPVELFDSKSDPYNMNNLAGRAEYAKIENRLKEELLAWMEYCGDKGYQTEMQAKEHQLKN